MQNYQQCKNDAYQTLRSQAGIAVGNIQVVAPMCVIFLMLVTWLHKWWNRVPLDESYTKAEKDSALDAYAMSLLLARDEKLKTHSFRGNNSIIALIAEELSEHTFLSAESHKTHSSYTLNLSNHSLNSNGGGDSSPTSRIYSKVSTSINARVRAFGNAVVMPVHEQDVMKIIAALEPERVTFARDQEGVEHHVTDKNEQDMSMREWIVAKKRGSLGDDGNGLDYARRGSVNAGSGHHNHHSRPHSRQESDNFDAALGHVMKLDANFGKGPSSFGVDEDSNKKWRC